MILAIKCTEYNSYQFRDPQLFFLCVSYRYRLFDPLSELIHSLAGPRRTTGIWDDFL